MISEPRTVLLAQSADVDSVQANDDVKPRALEFLRRVRESVAREFVRPCRLEIIQSIPSHCGFGSGTQLGLAIAQATSVLSGEPTPTLETLAGRAQRGLRSAIGLHGFEKGGFLVDGGRAESNRLGTLVARTDFPQDWRFVLAAPRQFIGLSGEAEQSAFAKQPPMPLSLTSELCRNVLMDWLPSVIEADFARCSESMFAFGHAVGEFFLPAQGGVFAHPRMSQWAALIRRAGICGVAQTSWGPTLAALCPSQVAAGQLQRDFASDAAWGDCTFNVVAPLNCGSTVRRDAVDTACDNYRKDDQATGSGKSMC